MSRLILTEGASPSTPATNKLTIFVKTDKKLYIKDDAGIETNLTDVTATDDVLTWVLNGAVVGGGGQDGPRAVRQSGSITGVIVSANERGDTGTALFDINKHVPAKPITIQRNNTAGVTIYTTQANRPDIVGDAGTPTENAIKQAPTPDITSFAGGDFFTVDVDDVAGEPKDVAIQVFVRYT